MSVVARVGVVYAFYMEQSSIASVYIFVMNPEEKYSILSPNISLKAQALISVHATANKIVPGLLVILL